MQISGLAASNTFTESDVLAIEVNGVTYKLTGAVLAASVAAIAHCLDLNDIANNLTTTAAGYALDARQGKALKDALDEIGTIENLGNRQNTGSVTLSKAITGYRFVQARVGYYESGFPNFGSLIVPTSNISLTSSTTYDYVVPCVDGNGAIKQVKFGFTSATEAHVSVNDISNAYVRFMGIK